MDYFFRANEDGYIFKVFGLNHIVLLALMFFIYAIIYINKSLIKESRYKMNIAYLFSFLLILEQVSLYLWYIFSGNFKWSISLPLYNCRLAIIVGAIALISKKESFLDTIVIYLGFYGSILAMLLPTDLDKFAHPHITNYTFFVGHMVLFWTCGYIYLIKGYEFTKTKMKKMIVFTNVFLLFLLFVNIITNGNYNYLLKAPMLRGLFDKIPLPLYIILVFSIYNLVTYIIYIIANRFRYIKYKLKEVNNARII